MKSSMVWYTIFMSIQRLCYLGGGGGVHHLSPPRGWGTGGKEHSSQGNRSTKAPINFEGKGNIGEQGKYGEQGNRYHLPSLGGPHQ